MNEEQKLALFQRAIKNGLIKDPTLSDKLNEAAPLWLVIHLILQNEDRKEPPSRIYD